jgi:hypothetical protein
MEPGRPPFLTFVEEGRQPFGRWTNLKFRLCTAAEIAGDFAHNFCPS